MDFQIRDGFSIALAIYLSRHCEGLPDTLTESFPADSESGGRLSGKTGPRKLARSVHTSFGDLPVGLIVSVERVPKSDALLDLNPLEHLLDAAQCLSCSLFVFDQREADMAVSVFTEANSRTDGNVGFCQELL